MYKLKAGMESFTVVDGSYAGRKYLRGRTYADIPPQEVHRFEEIKTDAFLGAEDSEADSYRTQSRKVKTIQEAASAAPENGEVR